MANTWSNERFSPTMMITCLIGVVVLPSFAPGRGRHERPGGEGRGRARLRGLFAVKLTARRRVPV